jgi:hypothetical protein
MQEVAAKVGIKIRTKDLVAIPFDDNVVAVNAAIEGSGRITIEELKSKGADVLFTFVSLPEGSQIESGFYKVRFYFNRRSNKWMAQWKNTEGSIVLETEAIVEPQSPDRAEALKQQPMCTLGPHGELILFDEHDQFKNILTTLRKGGGKPRPEPGPIIPGAGIVSARSIIKASNDLLETARRGVPYILVDHGKLNVRLEEIKKLNIIPVSLGVAPNTYWLIYCDWGPKPEYCRCAIIQSKSPRYIYAICEGLKTGTIYAFFYYE